MSTSKKKPLQQTAQEIEDSLGGLLGALGDAIGDMVNRLDEGTAGSFARDHVINTPKGPVRAQAGIRLRMGGMDVEGSEPSPQPVNRNGKAPPAQQSGSGPVIKPLHYEILEDHDHWVVTADMPGVQIKELGLSQEDNFLAISTCGERKFHARIEMAEKFDLDLATRSLRNGIMALRIPKGSRT